MCCRVLGCVGCWRVGVWRRGDLHPRYNSGNPSGLEKFEILMPACASALRPSAMEDTAPEFLLGFAKSSRTQKGNPSRRASLADPQRWPRDRAQPGERSHPPQLRGLSLTPRVSLAQSALSAFLCTRNTLFFWTLVEENLAEGAGLAACAQELQRWGTALRAGGPGACRAPTSPRSPMGKDTLTCVRARIEPEADMLSAW